jgi:ribonuclease BN (tRNA processing enzyme)
MEAVQAWAHSWKLRENSSRTNSKMAMMKALEDKPALRVRKLQVSTGLRVYFDAF